MGWWVKLLTSWTEPNSPPAVNFIVKIQSTWGKDRCS